MSKNKVIALLVVLLLMLLIIAAYAAQQAAPDKTSSDSMMTDKDTNTACPMQQGRMHGGQGMGPGMGMGMRHGMGMGMCADCPMRGGGRMGGAALTVDNGYVYVLAGGKLMKYDEKLNLVAETEVKLPEMKQMGQGNGMMGKGCPMKQGSMPEK